MQRGDVERKIINMDVRRTISSSNHWLDLKAKIDASKTTKEKGDIFELITKLYLQIDPRFVTKLKTVWLYKEIPTNTLKKLNLPTKDMGIDLIAETFSGEYWAIQCKYKADESKSLTWREISTFQSLAFSKAKGISFGLIATTVDRSASVFRDQKEDVKLLAGEVWRDLDEAFFEKARKILDRGIARPAPFKPRKHQLRAVHNAKKHFISEKATRGKMIMPCGTGKSLTAYWIAKQLEAKTILIAVPSLSLINQTLKAWLREVVANKQTVDWIAVCSDKTAGEVDSAISTQDLGIPTNTDPEMIARWLRKRSIGLKVVFTTYQSGKVIAEASRSAKRVFDLGIMDEAHKTVGDRDKTFAHLLSDDNIKIRKRVFMTATERRYAGNRDEIISMDNTEVYGDTFELLTFKEALEQEPPILSDYKILTMLIHKEDVAKYVQERAIIKPDRGEWDDGVQAEMLAGVVALNQAMEKYPIKHAVSFHTSIAKAQAFKANQQTYTEAVEKDVNQVETFFVSGKTPTSIRSRVVKEFATSEKALISNARCLTEGVDVPNIDGILFADPKRSAVDIVQAVGRALRLADGKDFGYIIIPVLIEDESDFEKSGAFQTILTVLRALASNDERVVEYFRDGSRNGEPKNRLIEHVGTEHILEKVNFEQFVESIELQSWSKLARLSWRPFEEAREFVRCLNLNAEKEWRTYCLGENKNLGSKPHDIPSTPKGVYKEWRGMGDWLGTGRIANQNKSFLPFKKAKNIVAALGLTSAKEYSTLLKTKTGKKMGLPAAPDQTYPEWESWGDWLGTSRTATYKVKYRDFKSARNFARSLKLKSVGEWEDYCKGLNPDKQKLPQDIPRRPRGTYLKDGWKGYGDWLGTGRVANFNIVWRDFKLAREYVRGLGLKSETEWRAYTSGTLNKRMQKPSDIPANPNSAYKNQGWISWGDWLGTFSSRPGDQIFLDFQSARSFAHRLQLKGEHEWRKYCHGELEKSVGVRPQEIPSNPNLAYKNKGWIGWGDWLGTGNVANYNKIFLPYSEAKKFTRKLGLKSVAQWREYAKGNFSHLPQKPADIPSSPNQTYDDWVSWYDFLGYKPRQMKKQR